MDEIVEKDIEDLKSKGKKIKIALKRTLVGVISAVLIFSMAPNIEYQIALNKANNSSYIEEVLSTNQTKEEKISQIFAQAIESNDKIPDDLKGRVIEAFTTEVINRAGYFFTNKTIKNMYAVASTQEIKQMSDFAAEHGWWNGYYNSFSNTYSLDNSVEDADLSLIAHEQLHAILKTGIIDTGFTNFIINGYGINEGTTSLFGKNDNAYFAESNIVDTLGLIIGYDTLFKYYVEGDLSGLKKELNQYISPQETNDLIRNLDLNVFTSYFETFLIKNNISYNSEKFSRAITNRNKKIIETMKKIFENKHGVSVEESKLGNLIFNNPFFLDDEDFDPNKTYYTIGFNDKDTVKLNITNMSQSYGVCELVIDKSIDELIGKELNDYIAKQLNVDGITGYSITSLNKHESKVIVNGIYIILDIDEIDNYDYDKVLNDLTNITEKKDEKTTEEIDNGR